MTSDDERVRFLVDQLNIRIWETDSDLRISYFAGALPALDALPDGSVIGATLFELHAGAEHVTGEREQLARLEAREPFQDYEVIERAPDGAPIHLLISGKPRRGADGAFLGYLGTIRDVTAETMARSEGEKSGAAAGRALLQNAIEVLDDGLAVFDSDDRLVTFNEAYRKIYGDLVEPGVTFRELYEDARRRNVIADRQHHAALWKARRMSREPGKLPPLEQPLTDGRWLRVTSARLGSGGSVELRSDITPLKVREQILQCIMDNIGDGVMLLGPDGTIREANQAAERMFGYLAGELEGEHVLKLLAAEQENEAARLMHSQLQEKPSFHSSGNAIPALGCRKRGKAFPIEVSLSTTTLGIEPVGVMSVRDVSQRHTLESQLAHADRLRTMGEMAASLAHELKQPLSVISMAAENAAIRIEDAGVVDAPHTLDQLSVVGSQVARIKALINHIVTFARREETEQLFQPEEALNDALLLFRSEFDQLGISLRVHISPDLPPLYGFPIRFGQAIVNLIGNSRDAVLARKERDPNAPCKVTVTLGTEDDWAHLFVQDTGDGIPDEIARTLFEPFVTTKPAGKGTGLGLSIVRSIIDGMNGRVAAENIEDGCCFTVSVPAFHRA